MFVWGLHEGHISVSKRVKTRVSRVIQVMQVIRIIRLIRVTWVRERVRA